MELVAAYGTEEQVTVARNVLKSYRPHEGLWPTEYIPAKREKAREKFQPIIDRDPELKEMADRMARRAAFMGG